MNHPNFELIFLGGSLFRSSQVTVGIPVYRALQSVYADWLLLGVCSVHPQIGLSGPDREEAIIKRFMLERAFKKIVLADSNKLNTAENYVIGSLGDIDYLVVEDDQKSHISEIYSKYKCKII